MNKNYIPSLLSCFFILTMTQNIVAQEAPVFDRPSPMTENWTTGPEVGERIPDFQGVDQNGVVRSFNDIKGPNGAYIVFQRSADW